MAYLTFNKAADSGLFVVESIRQYKDTVHENIVGLRPNSGAEESVPIPFDQFLAYLADDLDESRIDLVKSLELYLNEITGNEASNVERNEAVRDMRYWYQFTRDHAVNTCGETKAKEMGFDLATEQHPWRLERQTQRVINSFKDRDPEAQIEADDPEKQEGALSNGYIVRVLTPRHEKLVDVLGTWISTRRGTEKALIRKDAAFKVFEQRFSTHAKCAEMLYRWAGLEEEAKRIKPSVRRLGLREAVEDNGSEAGDAADAPTPNEATAPDPSVTPDSVQP